MILFTSTSLKYPQQILVYLGFKISIDKYSITPSWCLFPFYTFIEVQVHRKSTDEKEPLEISSSHANSQQVPQELV